MKKRHRLGIGLGIFLVLLVQGLACADDEVQSPVPILKPKNVIEQPLRPKRVIVEEVKTRRQPVTPVSEQMSLSVLAETPLLSENTFDKRFSSYGGSVLLSVPITEISDTFYLHVEGGIASMISSLALAQPAVNFVHIYFDLPVRVRVIGALSNRWYGEVFAGVVLKTFEYDSRPTTDGGFHGVTSMSFLQPDGGLGISYLLSPAWRVRLTAGVQVLALGAEFTL